MGIEKSYTLNSLSDVLVTVRGGCTVFYETDSVFVPIFCVNSKYLFVPTDKKWELDSTVAVEFRILDAVGSFVGDGVIESYENCTDEIFDQGLLVRLEDVQAEKISIEGRVRQVNNARRIAQQIALGAVRYAISEVRGNTVERDLGEPHAGFRNPVLLIQGWLGTRGVFNFLEGKLKRDGFPVFSFFLGRLNIQDITKSAEIVSEKLVRICEEKKIEKVSILGHSMGGLIGLYALKYCGIEKYVDRFIAVGTPFHGTPASWLGVTTIGPLVKSLWQMLPNSKFVQKLHARPIPPNVTAFSIMSKHDLLAPEKYCVLDEARNLLISYGHTALVVSDEVYDVVTSLLRGQDDIHTTALD